LSEVPGVTLTDGADTLWAGHRRSLGHLRIAALSGDLSIL